MSEEPEVKPIRRPRTTASTPPKKGRPSNAELAARLNRANVALHRLRKKESVDDTEAKLLAQVPDPEEKLPFKEWEKLPPELFQLQLDYSDCQELKLPLFVAGESPEDRTARIYEAILENDGIDHETALMRVKAWEKEFEAILEHDGVTNKEIKERFTIWEKEYEAKSGQAKTLPVPPQRSMPLVSEEDLPVPTAQHFETNPSGSLTPGQRYQMDHEREIEYERRRLLEHNIQNGEGL